jgi:hypothetical protein
MLKYSFGAKIKISMLENYRQADFFNAKQKLTNIYKNEN